MTSANTGIRTLTIDFVLPRGEALSIPWRGAARLFYVPVLFLVKHPAISGIDLRREDGRVVPLPNREDNAQVTLEALDRATSSMVRVPAAHRTRMRRYLRSLIRETDPEKQAAWLANLIGLAENLDAGGLLRPRGQRLRQLWRDVATDSVIWLPIVGTPGERRSIKLRHNVPVTSPRIRPRRRPGRRAKRFEIEGVTRSYAIYDPGDHNERGVVRRAWNRYATLIGWAAYDIQIETPYARSTQSYHLQVNSPPSLEMRRARLKCQLVDGNGVVRVPEREITRHSAHVYFAGLKVRRFGPAEVSLRVGRRGFLSFSAATSAVIAGMLWFFHAHSVAIADSPEVGATVLVVVPTLLVVFAVRPDEHELATRMLAGVRAALIIDGVLASAAATALAGGLPFGFRDAGVALERYAITASALATLLAISWLLGLDTTERVRTRLRRVLRNYGLFMVFAFVLLGLGTTSVWNISSRTGLETVEHWLRLTVLLGLALACGWLPTFAEANEYDLPTIRHRRIVGWLLSAAAIALVAAAVGASGVHLPSVGWQATRTAMRWVLLIIAVVCLSIDPLRRLGIPPVFVEDEDSLILDPHD